MRYFYLILSFVVASCTNSTKKNELLDPESDQKLLSPYFFAATSGIISVGEELTYVLKDPVENMPDEATLQQIIELSPKTEGTTTLSSNGVLRFKPLKHLKPGTLYEINIRLKKLNEKKYPEDIRYRIRTLEQDIHFFVQGPVLKKDGTVQLEVGVHTADIADPGLLASCFGAEKGKISIEEKYKGVYQLTCIFSAPYNEKSVIQVDGTPIGASKKETIPYYELNRSAMEVVSTYFDHNTKEFDIYFSQQLQPDADLTGLVQVQLENPSYNIHDNVLTIFVTPGPANENRTITLYPGILSADGKALEKSLSFEIAMDKENPAVAFYGNGNYFPGSGDFKIPVMTRALKSVRVTVIEVKQENVLHYLAWQSLSWSSLFNIRLYGRPVYDQVVALPKGAVDENGWTIHGLDLSEKVKRNPGSMYHVSMDFGPENTLLECSESLKGFDVSSSSKEASYFNVRSYYYNDYFAYQPYYSWEERNDPCKISYYINKPETERTFICSDFGVIAKRAGSSYHIAITQLADVSIVKGAKITLYNLQGMPMNSAKTDAGGMVVLDEIIDDAAVLMVEKDNKITYLPLDIEDANPLTEFDVAGERTEGESAFYIYTSRDVWRPGDTIKVQTMIHGNTSVAKGLPLVMKFYDPNKILLYKQVQPVDLENRQLHTFTVTTNPSAKTGLYHCIFQLGPKTLRKNIRIETITPNTSETVYNFRGLKNGTLYSKNLEGGLVSSFLTGQTIAGAKITATARVKAISNPFPNYKDYWFDTYGNAPGDQKWQAFSVVTNAAGTASFSSYQDLTLYNAPVYINLETNTNFVQGGTSTEGKTLSAYPLESYVGAKRKEGTGWDGSHTLNENIKISLVCVTAEGKQNPKAIPVSYTIQKHTDSWWVDKYQLTADGNFVNSSFWKDISVSKTTVKGASELILPKGSLEMGAYRITFVNDITGHATQLYFTVHDGQSRIPGSQPYILNFKTNKEEYKANEEVQILLPEIQQGKAWVSIERGDKIIKTEWLDAGSMSTLTAQEDWAPGVYIHVSLIQPHSRETNDLPLRMYGTRYIAVSSEKTKLQPEVSLPAKLEASTSYTFQVYEKQGLPMEYTIALVDEGLLNLTGFKTPNPWNHFNGKFPLLVRTWDVYKYMIEYFRGTFAGIISVGGDNAYHPDAIPEINRMKPIDIQMGPFRLQKNGRATHSIKIPGYAGKVRLMVVACNKEKFGNLEKQILVKNPLMVQSQLPRTLNVSDKIKIPVSVIRDDKTIKNVRVTARSSGIQIAGLKEIKNIVFSQKDQAFTTFYGSVPNQPGKLNIAFGAEGGKSKIEENGELTINYPGSPETRFSKQRIDPGKSVTLTVSPVGYPELFSTKMMVMGLKIPACTKYAEELLKYPYGCLEQKASAGFGQLFLDKIVSLSPQANQKREEYLEKTAEGIANFQRNDGKFNYWEGQTYHAWSDLYAGYYLIESKRMGIRISDEVLQRWVDAHSRSALAWNVQEASNSETYETESMVQAFRLFVLAKASKPAKSAMNRFLADNKASHPVTWWLIAGSFSLSGYESKAAELIKKAEALQQEYDESLSFETFGNKARDLAIATEILGYVPNNGKKQEKYYEEMVELLDKSPWINTQTQGFACIATGHYLLKNNSLSQDIEGNISGLKGGTKNFRQNGSASMEIPVDKSEYNKKITVRNTGRSPIYVHQTDTYSDNKLQTVASSSKLSLAMEVYNVTKKKAGMDGVQLGDELRITMKVTNPEPFAASNMALKLIVPSGLKLNNPRINGWESSQGEDESVYQDFRDDRVHSFFELAAGKSVHFTFNTRAAFAGDFYMPSARCESMYRGDIYATTASGRLVIKD